MQFILTANTFTIDITAWQQISDVCIETINGYYINVNGNIIENSSFYYTERVSINNIKFPFSVHTNSIVATIRYYDVFGNLISIYADSGNNSYTYNSISDLPSKPNDAEYISVCTTTQDYPIVLKNNNIIAEQDFLAITSKFFVVGNTKGYCISSGGSIIANVPFCYTNIIPIDIIQLPFVATCYTSIRAFEYYDINKGLIGYYLGSSNGETLTINSLSEFPNYSENIKYVRICTLIDNIKGLQYSGNNSGEFCKLIPKPIFGNDNIF